MGEGGQAERGQATAEWIGLLLGVTLAFGGALTAARGADFGGSAHGLGEALSDRMTCAVRETCADGMAGDARASRRSASRRSASRGVSPFLGRSPGMLPLGRGVPPALRAPSAIGTGRRLLRSLARAGEHAWLLCFGVRRLQQELDHAHSPRQTISPHDAVEVFNKCLNPLDFLLP